MGFPMLCFHLAVLSGASASVWITIPIFLAVLADVVDRFAGRRCSFRFSDSCSFFLVHAMLADPPAPAILAFADVLPPMLVGIVEQRKVAELARHMLDVGILPPDHGFADVTFDFLLRVSPGS